MIIEAVFMLGGLLPPVDIEIEDNSPVVRINGQELLPRAPLLPLEDTKILRVNPPEVNVPEVNIPEAPPSPAPLPEPAPQPAPEVGPRPNNTEQSPERPGFRPTNFRTPEPENRANDSPSPQPVSGEVDITPQDFTAPRPTTDERRSKNNIQHQKEADELSPVEISGLVVGGIAILLVTSFLAIWLGYMLGYHDRKREEADFLEYLRDIARAGRKNPQEAD